MFFGSPAEAGPKDDYRLYSVYLLSFCVGPLGGLWGVGRFLGYCHPITRQVIAFAKCLLGSTDIIWCSVFSVQCSVFSVQCLPTLRDDR